MQKLILASSSPYRAELLRRIACDFGQQSPDIDESPLAGENPDDLVLRLARQKAQKVAEQNSHSWVIASDQVACLGSEILGKPGSHQAAVQQLTQFSGQCLEFKTSLCLLNAATQWMQCDQVDTRVKFRHLEAHKIEAYLLKEQPYDCAGSFKCEGLGINLFESIKSNDPTALVGLPLISLCSMMRKAGIFSI